MSNKIDLDTLKSQVQEAAEPATVSAGETGLVVSKSKIRTPKSRSLTDIYTEQQKLVFLIDVSGSMEDTVAGASSIEMFSWNEHDMKNISERVQQALNEVSVYEDAAAKANGALLDQGVDPESIDVPEPSGSTMAWVSLQGLEGDELKHMVIQKGLDKQMYLYKTDKYRELATKLGLVKKMAQRMVEERFQKLPDADIACLTFDTRTEALPFNDKDGLVNALGKITARGGTNIYGAIEAAMEACQHAPSVVNLHHLVLVTDGEDHSAIRLPDLIPAMKKQGVVLDFIWIKQPYETGSDRAAAAIQKVVAETNGTYTEVSNADEFTSKFIAATTRLMLPPGSNS